MRKMLEMRELMDTLTHLPEYDKGIRLQPATKRLLALEDSMSQIYIPNQMAIEIYNRMYLAVYKAEQKKNTAVATKQYYENFKVSRSVQTAYQGGVIGGSDVFTLIGDSGIGKTTAIQKAIGLIQDNSDEHINVLQVQCPNDCSTKGLLLSILQAFDDATGSDYLNRVVLSRYTVDMLIGMVSIACQNYLNLLVVDEIQNVKLNMKSKATVSNGEKIIATLVQLINSTGISVMLVGTPEVEPVFQKEIHLARRTVGLRYKALPYGKEFHSFCEAVYGYQYAKKAEPFSEKTSMWLYQHTAGKIALIVGLIKTAQEISILNGTDCLGIVALETAYKERFQNIHEFVKADAIEKLPKPKNASVQCKKSVKKCDHNDAPAFTFKGIADTCKKECKDIVEEIRLCVPVREVKLQ